MVFVVRRCLLVAVLYWAFSLAAVWTWFRPDLARWSGSDVPSREHIFSAFTAWCRSRGIAGPVEVRAIRGGGGLERGLFAAGGVPRGGRVVSVPRSAQLCLQDLHSVLAGVVSTGGRDIMTHGSTLSEIGRAHV